jgi:hypothetical protein
MFARKLSGPTSRRVTSYEQLRSIGGLLRATHTIGVAQRAPRRSLRSSHFAELAGRSGPHCWAPSGLPHPGELRRENPAPLSLDCHFYSNEYTKNAVELRGFEPLTFCMPYRPGLSLDVAGRRPAWRLPAITMAGCGLTLPGACRRWLPTWLPGNSSAAPTSGRPNRAAGAPEAGGDDLPRPSPRRTRPSSGPPTRAPGTPAPAIR